MPYAGWHSRLSRTWGGFVVPPLDPVLPLPFHGSHVLTASNTSLSPLAVRSHRINTPEYLIELAERFKALGGRIVRVHLKSLSDAMGHVTGRPRAIINCTGLGALHLDDVKDHDMFPTRGQLCIVRAPWIKYGKTVIGRGWTSYTIPRENGMVVIGGTREANDWCVHIPGGRAPL